MTVRLLLLVLSLPLVSMQAQDPSPPAGCDPIASDSARFGTTPVFAACEPEFGAAVRNSLSRWRYAPAQRAGVPVRQLVVGRLAQSEMRVTKVPFTVVTTGPGMPQPTPRPTERPRQTESAPCQ